MPPEHRVPEFESDKISVEQVSASFVTAGIPPVGDPGVIARLVSGQLTDVRSGFAPAPFDVEPATFLKTLVEESL